MMTETKNQSEKSPIDKKKMVKLIVENLLWSRINFDPHKASRFPTDGENNMQILYRAIKAWEKGENTFELPDKRIEITEDWIFDVYLKAKVFGGVTGELRDEDHEQKVRQLELEITKWKAESERLRSDNILLANELHDKNNVIETYERGTYKNDKQ